MSKFTVYEQVIIDRNQLCKHNKKPCTIQTVYRQEKPIRLAEKAYLNQIGQCKCHLCREQNKILCQCYDKEWSMAKMRNYYRRQEDEYDMVYKDATIFSFKCKKSEENEVTSPAVEHQQANKESKHLTVKDKFRQGYKKSKEFWCKTKEDDDDQKTMKWLMRPVKEMRNSNMNLTQTEDKNDDKKLINNPKNIIKKSKLPNKATNNYKSPIDCSSQLKCLNSATSTSTRNLLKYKMASYPPNQRYEEFLKQTNFKNISRATQLPKCCHIHSLGRKYPIRVFSSENTERGNNVKITQNVQSPRNDLNSGLNAKDVDLSKTAAIVEFFSNTSNPEDIQYKPSKLDQQLNATEQRLKRELNKKDFMFVVRTETPKSMNSKPLKKFRNCTSSCHSTTLEKLTQFARNKNLATLF